MEDNDSHYEIIQLKGIMQLTFSGELCKTIQVHKGSDCQGDICLGMALMSAISQYISISFSHSIQRDALFIITFHIVL